MKVLFSFILFFITFSTLSQELNVSTDASKILNPVSPDPVSPDPVRKSKAIEVESKKTKLEIFHSQSKQLKVLTFELEAQISALKKLQLLNNTSLKVI